MKFKSPQINHWHCLRNEIVCKILKLLGFSVCCTILAGEVKYSGKILYMTISSAKLEFDSNLTSESHSISKR